MPPSTDTPQIALALFLALTAAIATAPSVRGLMRAPGPVASVAELAMAPADPSVAPPDLDFGQ